MTGEEIKVIVDRQKAFFHTGDTLKVSYRIAALNRLKKEINLRKDALLNALRKDLGKSAYEAYMCEVGLSLSEISYMIAHTRRFAAEKTVHTPMTQYVSRSFRKPVPRGTCLIMSPWNYPFLLTIEPLADALAAGNTVVLKPSAYSPNTSQAIKELVEACFPPEYVTVITGGREENKALLSQKFDYIFFTGSQAVGKEVMRKAAEHLTPVTLELGGKSPCIVDASANIRLTAKRLVMGKYLNLGQTCVAPDYVLCQSSVKDELIEAIRKEIRRQFGESPLQNPDYGHIINKKHFDRVKGLIDEKKVVIGGGYLEDTLQITPTVMDGVTWDDAVMQEEIFGPVLPILTFDSIREIFPLLQGKQVPLALYIFSTDKRHIRQVISRIPFGGGCINDTIMHLTTSDLPFGGCGESGMGSYHGRVGFETFSHMKSVMDKKLFLDLPMRYQPYRMVNDLLVHMFLR